MSYTDAPPLTDRFDRIRQCTLHAAGQLALIAAVWLALIRFPAAPTAGLDPSWRLALSYASEHGWQFGKDIVFTYGPLGYLLAGTNSGGLYTQHLIWQLGANLLFAVAIWFLGRRFAVVPRILYYIYFFSLGIVYGDALQMLLVVIFASALTDERIVTKPALVVFCSVLLSALALIKFTNFMLAGFSVGCAAGLYAWNSRWSRVALISLVSLGTFLGGWMALGQHLGNLPAYIVNSLSVSSGYVDAMALDETGAMLACGVISALAVLAYFSLVVWQAEDRPRTLAFVLIVLGASFLNWKHGFVRADGHVLAHFIVAMFVVCVFPGLVATPRRFHRVRGALLVAAAISCITGIWLNSPPTLLYAPSILNTRIVDNANTLRIARDIPRNARAEFVAVQKSFQLPGARALAGRKTVDVFGDEQSYAILNGLNYRARPALQGYAAYNRHLEQLDLDFMASDRAPDLVLQKINGNTVDDRLPAMDDALAVRYLYHHYEFLMEERDFLIWRRKSHDPARDEKKLISTASVRWGVPIAVPDREDAPVWCEIEFRPSLLGRLRTFFYKPPVLRAAVTDGGGIKTTFRFVPGQAATGFLTYPHFTSNLNVAKYQEGERGPRIASLLPVLDAKDRKYFSKSFQVRFYELPTFPRSGKITQAPAEVRYRAFNQVPSSVNSPVPIEILVENGKDVLFAHPPSTLEFRLSPRQRHVTGEFGFVARAYTGGNATDGADFSIEWTDENGLKSVLFSRHLNPLAVPSDRGEQGFDLAIPAGGGRMVFQISPGPANNIAFDWTYWADVKFSE